MLVASVKQWVGRVWIPYTAFLVALVAVTALAGTRNRVMVVVAAVALAAIASWLNEVVRLDRADGDERGPARALLAVGQLLVAILFLFGGAPVLGQGADSYFFFGVALAIMSVAALTSEARRSRWLRRRHVGPWTVGVSVALLVLAALVPTGAAVAWLVAIGVVGGEVGTELTSEASHGWGFLTRWRWLVCAVGGAALLVVAYAALVAAGGDPGAMALVVAVLVAVQWMASSDNDSLFLVVLVAAALIWATRPLGDDPVPRHQPEPGERYFVVLGDSYISGEGAHKFLRGTNTTDVDERDHIHECRRANTAWPFLLADANPRSVPDRLLFLACSGAVTENIHTEPRVDAGGDRHGPAELALYERTRAEVRLPPPEFVLVSVGGNDAGFGLIGETCVGPGNCAEVGQQFLDDPDRRASDQPVEGPPGAGQVEALAAIADDLNAAYARIADTFPGVPVIAVPYPLPIEGTARCRDVLLAAEERRFVAGFVRELNNLVEAAARRHGFHFMDTMEDALRARGALLCDESGLRSGLNFLAFNPKAGTIRESLAPTNWTHNSLHPNEHGHVAMRDAAIDWFEDHPTLAPLDPDPEYQYAVRDVDAVTGDPPVPQCEPARQRECELDDRGWLFAQVHRLYTRALGPLAFVMFGSWLLLAPLLWFARQRGISVAKAVRCTLARPRPPGA